MLINGKERSFKLTVGASKKVSRLCPDKDINKIGDLFKKKNTEEMMDIIANMCVALNEGYELEKKFKEPGYEPDIITLEEIDCLSIAELEKVETELLRTLGFDMQPEIETEPIPQKGKKTGKKASK